MRSMHTIERLQLPACAADLDGLAALLALTVDAGASVSFLAPLPVSKARVFWERSLAAPHPRAVSLVARDAGGIIGTAHLQPAWAPNQPHRAEVVKVIVHPDRRRLGLARRLMEHLEAEARAARFTLLTLDTVAGGPAEVLYQGLGWLRAGAIPDFALDSSGERLQATVLYYRQLV